MYLADIKAEFSTNSDLSRQTGNYCRIRSPNFLHFHLERLAFATWQSESGKVELPNSHADMARGAYQLSVGKSFHYSSIIEVILT